MFNTDTSNYKVKMNYRGHYLNKNEKNIITRSIKKMNLSEHNHTLIIDVGKSYSHKIELVVNVFSYDGFKNDGITYEYVKMVTLVSAKYIRYQTSVGTYINEEIINTSVN